MKTIVIYLVLAALLFSSCGYSVVKLSNTSKPYAVYVDKKYMGMSTSKIKFQRSGFPQKKLIEVKDNYGRVVAYEKISRDFNAAKFLVGFFYLWPIWLYMWEYDAKIEVYIDNQRINSVGNQSPWDTDSVRVNKSPWD